jgi:hypothetical protein
MPRSIIVANHEHHSSKKIYGTVQYPHNFIFFVTVLAIAARTAAVAAKLATVMIAIVAAALLV